MSIWYDVRKIEFELELKGWPSEDDNFEQPAGLVHLGDNRWALEHHDEGFATTEELAPYLSKAKGKHRVRVHMSDHKGATSYDIVFGPGYCREEQN